MSAGSGIAEKGDAAPAPTSSIATKSKEPTAASAPSSKPSYATLNINDLYRGKSLEQSKTPAPRHGMQTLGKVVRRNQAPASATGLSAGTADGTSESTTSSSAPSSSDQPNKQSGSEASNPLPNSHTVPGSLTGSSLSSSSNSGWPAVQSADTTVPAGPVSQTMAPDAASCQSKQGSGSRQPSAASSGSGSVTTSTPWSAAPPAAAAAATGAQGPDRMFSEQMRGLGKPSLLPAQEFPELGVEEVPAVRPADVRQQPLSDPGPYGPGPSLRPAISSNWSHGSANAGPGSGPGGGVNGSQPNDRNPQQPPATGSQAFGGPASTGSGAAGGAFRAPGGQSVQRNPFPGSGGGGPPSGSGQDFRGNRTKSGKEEPPLVKFNASIVPDEKISEFDEILEKGDIRPDWTAICDAIDYDQDLNFDLDDSALDAALKTKQTSAPISESNSLSASASSAAVDIKADSGRKHHSFEDEYTRSPPHSGRVLYDPRDQKQGRGPDNRSSGPRSRRTSEKSDDMHSEGRGSAPKGQPYGRDARDGNRAPGHDSLRGAYKQQSMQQTQLPPRFQKQLQQQQQQNQQQQLYHQQQQQHQRGFDGRGPPDMDRHRRDGQGLGPHHNSEWRGAPPPPPSQRMDSRPSHMNAHVPATSSAADEMNWRSASKKVTAAESTSRTTDPRGPATGISTEKEITILRHEKNSNPPAGHRLVTSSLTAAVAAPSPPVAAAGSHCQSEQPSLPKTSPPKSDPHPVPSAHPIANTGWPSDGDNVAVAVQSNHWQSVAPVAEGPDARSQPASHDRSARMANLTTLGKKKSGGPAATPADAPAAVSVKSRSDDSSWRRKTDEQLQPSDREEQNKRSPPVLPATDSHPNLNQRTDLRQSQESQPASSSGVRGSGDGSLNSDHSQFMMQRDNRRTNDSDGRDYNRQNLPPQSQQNAQPHKQRNQRHEERRHETRPDNRTDARGPHRRDEYQQYGQPRDQRRDNTRRRLQEESMTFDYRDLPKNALSGIVSDTKEISVPTSGTKEHVVSQQFPAQKSDNHRKGQQTLNSRSSGPVLARVAGNSNYGPPPSKAAFESKSGTADSRSKPLPPDTAAGSTSSQSRQLDNGPAKREHEGRPTSSRHEAGDSWKNDRSSVPRDEKHLANNQYRGQYGRDDQRGNQRAGPQNYDSRPQRDVRKSDHPNRSDRPEQRSDNRTDQRRENRGNERQNRSDRRPTPPESEIPPRFRKIRSGTESSKGSRSGQPDKSRSSASHPESDVANEEWETASESSHKDLIVPPPSAAPSAISAPHTTAPHKSQAEKSDSHRNGRERKPESSRPDRRQDRFDGGRDDRRDDRRDAGRRKAGRSDDRAKDDRRNSNRPDQRHDEGRGNRNHAEDGGRRRRDDNRDHRQSENSRSNNSRKWTDGQQSKGNVEAIVQQMNQVKLDDPNAPESALSSLKKDMQSLSLNERREEKHSEPHTDGFLVVDRHKKRAKGSNEGTESKKMKPEVSVSSKSRHSKTTTPRVSSKMSGSRDLRLQKLSDDAFKVDPERLSSMGGHETDSPSKENAWSKPLSHAQPTRSTASTAVTFASVKADVPRPVTTNAAQLAISSKTSSFEHQDSGVDVGSDHPPSAASSQRSSPNNGTEKKTGQLPAKSPLAAAAPISEESPEPPVQGTIIFENRKYRQQNEALAGIPENSHMKVTAGPRPVRSSGPHPAPISHISNDVNRSKVHPIRPPVQPQHRPKEMPTGQSMASDLEQKMASVKKVWSDPASPGIGPDLSGDNHPAKSKSPATRNPYPPGVGPVGANYGMVMPADSMSAQMNSMKQMQSGRQQPPQQQPHPQHQQYQRSLSGHYMTSNSPPVNMMNQISSPPPQLEAMRQHLSQHHQHQQQQQQQQQHYVQQGGGGGSGHAASIANPPVSHPMYNMATIANMYSPAFNQHMDPRASVQLQAFAQQLAFHQNQGQHPIRSQVQSAAPHPAAYASASQLSDYRNMGQVSAAVGQHQHQPQHQQPQHPQQQQSNLMKAQYMQPPNFHFWNR